MHVIGEETSQRQAQFRVVVTHRPKYEPVYAIFSIF